MTADEIAARFDSRPGFQLVDYGDVGLPFFVVTANAIVQESKSLHPIEEFVLRSRTYGLKSTSDIAGFLGLQRGILDKVLVPMLQDDVVGLQRSGSSAGDMEVVILANGRRALSEAGLVRPEERSIYFTYDGLTRKPKFVEMQQLLLPKEVKDAGIAEIPALPARGPEVDEVNVLEVEDVIALATRTTSRTRKIFKLRSFESRVRHFLPAVALVFRDETSGEHRVSFAISGRLSEEHERAFAASDGLKRSQRFAGLSKSVKPELRDVLDENIARKLPKPKVDKKAKAALTAARVGVSDAERHIQEATSEAQRTKATEELEKARALLEAANAVARREVVRPLPVYEHPALLAEAIKTAEVRLLILSPWIRRSVVNRALVKEFEGLLKRGVRLHVGYGLGEKDTDALPRDRDAEADLERLAKSYGNFALKRFGDTHAKIIIKDSEYFVISSFNWLSFQGDPNRTFREEWGTLVAIPQQVDELYGQLVKRFEGEAAGG